MFENFQLWSMDNAERRGVALGLCGSSIDVCDGLDWKHTACVLHMNLAVEVEYPIQAQDTWQIISRHILSESVAFVYSLRTRTSSSTEHWTFDMDVPGRRNSVVS